MEQWLAIETHKYHRGASCRRKYGRFLGQNIIVNPSGSTQTLKQLSSNRCIFQKKEPKSNGLTTVFMIILRLYNVQATEMKLKNNRYTTALD